jgi:HEAT repeat protein
MNDPMHGRTGLRRLALAMPDGARHLLLPLLAREELVAPLGAAAAIERLAAYLLDPMGRAILALDGSMARWIERSPLMHVVGPGNGAPILDDVAAVMVAPTLAHDTIPPIVWKWRWSPRADELVAAVVAALPPDAGERELARLVAEPGPDEERVHQGLLQAGRTLAWAPHLHDAAPAAGVVDRLLALLDRSSPRPLLEALTAALGPIARIQNDLGERVRHAVEERLAAAVSRATPPARKGGSFSALITDLDENGGTPGIAEMRARPDFECAEFCAHILGAGAPTRSPDEFDAYRLRIVDHFGDLALFPAFLDGLIQCAATEPLGQLVLAMTASDPDDRGIAAELAGRLPLRNALPALLDLVEDEAASIRADAVRGLALISDEHALAAIEARLDDPSPEVAARAATTLVDLGHTDRARGHRDGGDPSSVRAAAIRAALGDTDVETIGELAVALNHKLEVAASSDEDDLTDSPLLVALANSLFTSPRGLERAAQLIGGVPDALPVVALAATLDADPPAVLAPPGPLAELRDTLAPLLDTDDEARATAFALLARFSAGDEELATRCARALDDTQGWAGQLLAALSDLRVRSKPVGDAVAALLGPDVEIGGRILAAVTAGRTLPTDHSAWARIHELLELGTYARAAAWTALRDRVRLGAGL